jgi:hypothetical protein
MTSFIHYRSAKPSQTANSSGPSPGFRALAPLAFAVATMIASPATAQSVTGATSGQFVQAGLEIDYAIIPALTLKAYPLGDEERNMHGGIPSSAHANHFMVAVFDAETHQRISDAFISATVREVGANGQTRMLEPMDIGNAVTYGNYFDIWPATHYRVTMSVSVSQLMSPHEVQFQFEGE